MKYLTIIFFCLITFAVIGCRKDDATIIDVDSDNSYLPMQVGNYWRINDENYIIITGTKMIDKELFYEFSSRVGGDAFGKRYYRIDENNNLIEKYPDHPGESYTHAKFNMGMNESFWTTGKKDVNDLNVRILKKDGDQITFEYTWEYHINLKGSKTTRTFQKGLGYLGYKEVKIRDEIYKF